MGISSHSIAHDEARLREQARWVIKTYRQPALVEAYLPGREFTVGLIGNTRVPGQPRRSPLYDERGFHVFPIEEVDASHGAGQGVYNVDAKSADLGAEDCPIITCPARIPPALEMEIKQLTVAAFETLGCFDLARVDFKLDAAGRPNIVEINQLPGLRPGFSDMCIAAEAEGMSYNTLIGEILNLALERHGLLHRVARPLFSIGEPQRQQREEILH